MNGSLGLKNRPVDRVLPLLSLTRGTKRPPGEHVGKGKRLKQQRRQKRKELQQRQKQRKEEQQQRLRPAIDAMGIFTRGDWVEMLSSTPLICGECGAETAKLHAPILLTRCPGCGTFAARFNPNAQDELLIQGKDGNHHLAVPQDNHFVIELPNGPTRLHIRPDTDVGCSLEADEGRLVFDNEGILSEASGCFRDYGEAP